MYKPQGADLQWAQVDSAIAALIEAKQLGHATVSVGHLCGVKSCSKYLGLQPVSLWSICENRSVAGERWIHELSAWGAEPCIIVFTEMLKSVVGFLAQIREPQPGAMRLALIWKAIAHLEKWRDSGAAEAASQCRSFAESEIPGSPGKDRLIATKLLLLASGLTPAEVPAWSIRCFHLLSEAGAEASSIPVGAFTVASCIARKSGLILSLNCTEPPLP